MLSISGDSYLNISVQNYINFSQKIFLIDLDYLHSQKLLELLDSLQVKNYI